MTTRVSLFVGCEGRIDCGRGGGGGGGGCGKRGRKINDMYNIVIRNKHHVVRGVDTSRLAGQERVIPDDCEFHSHIKRQIYISYFPPPPFATRWLQVLQLIELEHGVSRRQNLVTGVNPGVALFAV